MSLREAARSVFDAALRAADVRPLVRRALADARPAARGRVLVVGAGKASGAMAAAAEDALGDRIADGLVVVKDGYLADDHRVRLVEAGHPVPDARGEAAARQIRALAESAGADDLLLVLVSGGGSALTPAPVPPITLADKQAMTRLLLAAGANINQLNAVRKHCSRLKGGQLARAAAPARVHALLLSDVIGDPLDVIASGPTAPDASTFAEALAILDRFELRSRAPAAIVERLGGERPARSRRRRSPRTPCSAASPIPSSATTSWSSRPPPRRRARSATPRTSLPARWTARRARWRERSSTSPVRSRPAGARWRRPPA